MPSLDTLTALYGFLFTLAGFTIAASGGFFLGHHLVRGRVGAAFGAFVGTPFSLTCLLVAQARAAEVYPFMGVAAPGADRVFALTAAFFVFGAIGVGVALARPPERP